MMVSEDAWEAVPERFDTEQCARLPVKAIERDIVTYRVLAQRAE